MTEAAVKLTIDARGVATLQLNRANVHNAFDDVLIAQLNEHIISLGNNESVRVVILSAAGKSFSAGADLNWMKRMATYDYADNLRDATLLSALLKNLNQLPKPTIARVQGAAFGGGVGLISCCDIAIASESASFSLSEVKLGLVPATISPYVIAAIGERAARRYFVSAERFNAETALRIGLISERVNADKLDLQIESLVTAILANGPHAVSIAKQLILDVSKRAIDDTLITHTSELIAQVRNSKEGKEGLTAFLEKRTPNW